MTAPERFAEKSDSLLQRGRRPYMTHSGHRGGFQLRCNKRLDASFDHLAWGRLRCSPRVVITASRRARLIKDCKIASLHLTIVACGRLNVNLPF
jgi:hypothetical protein